MEFNVKEMANAELISSIKLLRGKECQVLADIILHLAEIDERGIYREAGYSSLFNYCFEGLGYSEGASARRVRAARAYRERPEVYELLRAGKISLSALSEVAPVISTEVLQKTQGASKREAQQIAVAFGAPKPEKRPSIRAKMVVTKEIEPEPVVEKRFGFSFDVKPEVKDLYDEARALMGHLSPAEVFERALKEYVYRKKGIGIKTRKVSTKAEVSRHLPIATRRSVLVRDNCQCTFVSSAGQRCSEKVGLQVDHIVPFARGGSHGPQNLRLRCFKHNQLHAEQCFGKAFMAQVVHQQN